MKSTGLLLTVAMSLTLTHTAQAATLSSDDARSFVTALKTAGITGQSTGTGAVEYAFDLECVRNLSNVKDTSKSEYGVFQYTCNVGAGMVYLAKAGVIFNEMTRIFGTSSVGEAVVSTVNNLVCRIDLSDESLTTRFTCSHD